MLFFSLISSAQNAAPSVSAGNTQTIKLPTNSVTLTGKACDADGSIASYLWTGTFGTITSPSSATTTITGLNNAGNFVFTLRVRDNGGVSRTSTVTVIVNPANPPINNAIPKVQAGVDIIITLPTDKVTLNGMASDNDGTVSSFLWTKEVGPGAVIESPNHIQQPNQQSSTTTTVISGLSAGEYRIRLTATDNNGGAGSDTIHISVKPQITQPPANPPPTAGYTETGFFGFNANTNTELDPDGHGQIGNGSFVASPKTEGVGCFKSVPANISSGIRSEVQFDAGRTSNEGAVEYDVMYEVAFQNDGHSFQFHPNTDGGSASPGLWHTDGKFDVVNWKGGANAHHNTGVTIQTNRWYHIRFEWKFGSSGYWRTYIDGTLIPGGSWTGQVGDGSGQYLKVGVNMWKNQSSIVYYDNVKIYRKG